jgi:hypothetical protein
MQRPRRSPEFADSLCMGWRNETAREPHPMPPNPNRRCDTRRVSPAGSTRCQAPRTGFSCRLERGELVAADVVDVLGGP